MRATDPYAFRTHVLPTGMRVYCQHRPLPFTAFRLMYHAGCRQDPRDKLELMHLLEHRMGMHLPGYPSSTISELQEWAATSGYHCEFGETSLDSGSYIGWAENRRVGGILRFLHALTQHPGHRPDIENEKHIIRAERDEDRLLNDRRTDAARVRTVFGSDPAGSNEQWGEDHHINAITIDDLRAAHERWYHPANASLIAVGGVTDDRLLRRIEELFVPRDTVWVPETPPLPKTFAFRDRPRRPYRQRAKKGRAPETAHVRYYWFHAPLPEASVRVAIRGLWPRVQTALREGLGMSYEIEMETNHFRDFVVHYMAFDVAPGTEAVARNAVRSALADAHRHIGTVRTHGIDAARASAAAQYRLSAPDPEATMVGASADLESFGRIITHAERKRAIAAVTVREVRDLYADFLAEEAAYIEYVYE